MTLQNYIEMYIQRHLSKKLKEVANQFPILSLTGPRQSGKTTLLRNEFTEYKYINLERPDLRKIISEDPMGYLRSQGIKLIIDEVQNLPELFSYLQVLSDENNETGQYILSGSQNFLLNKHIAQSLAGRVYTGNLLPFDFSEISSKDQAIPQLIWQGFYPRLMQMNINPSDFYPSYLQTYIERDIRSLKNIEKLSTFTRFLSLCAGRTGQILNLTSLANDAGISVNTAKDWLSLLESSYIIFLLQPYYQNFNKRLIKAPKLYFYDTGVASNLLRIKIPEMLYTHYLYGSLFENLIIAEIIKQQLHNGQRPSAYYWRESNGNEIDCIIEHSPQHISAIEIKAGESFTKDFLKNLKKLPDTNIKIDKLLIYNGHDSFEHNNINILSCRDFIAGKQKTQ